MKPRGRFFPFRCSPQKPLRVEILRCKRLQLDEMLVVDLLQGKESNGRDRPQEPDAGDVWLWVAVDADTKLVPSWRLGQRDLATAKDFVNDLASRLSKRVQIISDGHRPYLEAIEGAFGSEVDYSQLHKIYGATSVEDFRRYSPAR